MPELDGEQYDVAILTGRACRPQDYDPERRQAWNAAIAAGLQAPPDYPGAVFEPCEQCGIEIQIGPRQQEARQKITGKVLIVCLLCAAEIAASDDAQTTLHNLGNPHQEGP